MFQNSGLSLDQAPPIQVVLRLFLSGSIFGVIASLMLFFWHDSLSNLSDAKTLAIVHSLTLGVMASFMLGALFQMMPVLCGVSIKTAQDLALRVNYTLFFGTLFLIFAFLYSKSILFIIASILLGFAIFTSAYSMIKNLIKIEHSSSSRGMLIALFGLTIAVILALLMVGARAGINIDLNYINIKTLHYNFGLFAWVAILIISVSFQVIEMFYVAPPYNKIYSKYITMILFVVLILYAISLFVGMNGTIFPYIISLIIASFSIYTLYNLKRKKRPLRDASFYFWVLGLSFAIFSSLATIFNLPTLITATLFAIFPISIVFAMSYKIVPFLVWFHLNAQGYFDAPMMHEVVSPKYAKGNFWLLFMAAIFLTVSTTYAPLYYLASILLLLSFGMLFVTIYNAFDIYSNTIKYGKKINLSFS